MLPAVDAHAHIQTSVSKSDLFGLKAIVFAVTREASEWKKAMERHDDMAIWGVGIHPRIPFEVETFSSTKFEEAVNRALLVGEVGLDQKTISMKSGKVFDEILAIIDRNPRPASIHSVGASRQVVDALLKRPVAAPILHWWRGSQAETKEAISLGSFFSLNGAEARDPKVLSMLPPERVLTETDFPHSRRRDPAAIQPAAVSTIEAALMAEWGLGKLDLRQRLWRNIGDLFERCELLDRLPPLIQETILTVGLE